MGGGREESHSTAAAANSTPQAPKAPVAAATSTPRAPKPPAVITPSKKQCAVWSDSKYSKLIRLSVDDHLYSEEFKPTADGLIVIPLTTLYRERKGYDKLKIALRGSANMPNNAAFNAVIFCATCKGIADGKQWCTECKQASSCLARNVE